MKASETTLQPLLEGVKQYVIPLFQRAYRWRNEDWDTLWQDLVDLYESQDNRDHFLGAIVTMPVDMSPHGINKYLLIDGQQRLTTLFILLALIRDLTTDKDAKLSAQINELYLLNKWEDDINRYKLLPTQVDRLAFFEIIDDKEIMADGTIAKAAHFFRRKLRNTRVQNGNTLDLRRLQAIILQQLTVVSIVLAKDENPYLIFESLNGKGQPLTQADLVRNYLFMRIPQSNEQNVAYKELWLPIEQRLGEQLSNFFWRYLTKDGAFIRQNAIYDAIKNKLAKLDVNKVVDELLDMHTFSTYYQRLIDPTKEPKSAICTRLMRLNRWEINTAYPFLLSLYDDYEHGRITVEEFCAVLDTIESYVIRRFFYRIPTNALNRIFISLYRSVDVRDIVHSTQAQLLERNWPSDEQFLDGWIRFPIYTSGSAKCRHVLESLEAALSSNNEPVDMKYPKITIEHVMPQTLNAAWEEELGPQVTEVHGTYLHTIGNLTLTGKNEPMGNAPFATKQITFSASNFALNKHFATCHTWNEEAIRQRALDLGQIALATWRRPSALTTSNDDADPTGHQPIKFRLFNGEYSVHKWREVLIGVCKILAERHGPSFIATSLHITGTSRQYFALQADDLVNPALIDGTDLWVETNFSARDIIRVVGIILNACGYEPTVFKAFW